MVISLALLSPNHLPQMIFCKISMVSLRFNGQSSSFILFNSPGALDRLGYSFLPVTLLFLDIETQLFPSSSPFLASPLWPSMGGTQVLMSFLFIPISWIVPSTLTVSVTINAQESGVHAPTLHCFPSFRLDQQITKLPVSTWMPLPDKIESITFPWNHFSTHVLYIHI